MAVTMIQHNARLAACEYHPGLRTEVSSERRIRESPGVVQIIVVDRGIEVDRRGGVS